MDSLAAPGYDLGAGAGGAPAGRGMVKVTIRERRKSCATPEAIRRVDLGLVDGQSLGLAGPSGCGRSKVLRTIAELEGVAAGTIRIGEGVVNNLPSRERDIAIVFQNHALYPRSRVATNRGLGRRMAPVRAHLFGAATGECIN